MSANPPGPVTAVPVVSATKPAIKTTEFWITVLAGAIPYVIEGLPPTAKVIASTVVSVGYSVSRGLAKLGVRFPWQR